MSSEEGIPNNCITLLQQEILTVYKLFLDKRIPTIKVPSIEGYNTLWTKTKGAFRYVWDNYRDQADWFLKADDDSYKLKQKI